MAIISPKQDEKFSHLLKIGGGMFRYGLRMASAAMSLELLAQTKVQRLEQTIHHTTEYKDMLKCAVKRMLEQSAERIRHGESNVKNHPFLSMVLAEVEAAETGAPVELKVAEAARNSLHFCHQLLIAQTGLNTAPWLDDIDLVDFPIDFDDNDFFSN